MSIYRLIFNGKKKIIKINNKNFALNFGTPGDSTTPEETSYMYYGRLSIAEVGGSVISYNQINEEMIINGLNMHKVEPTTMGKTSMGKETTTKAYDYIVVAVPASSNYNVTQDNGFGKKVPFREEYQGANGIPITINGEAYKLYGEIILTQGEKFIYIDEHITK